MAMARRYGNVVVVPCSGIDGAFGTIGREATYIAVDDLRPGVTDMVCVSLLGMGDQEATARVRGLPCVTVDACPDGCARKIAELSGCEVMCALQVEDTFEEHRDLRSDGITEVDEPGRRLARLVADRIAAEVDEIREELQW